MLIDADRIRELVPHSERMCLLERVLDWSAKSIRCETNGHLDPDNPLRRNGRLSSICGIEYAAQAMALHSALGAAKGDSATRHGYLASARNTRCHTATLDVYKHPLFVDAELVYTDGSRVIYSFSIECGGASLVTGRAAVVLG